MTLQNKKDKLKDEGDAEGRFFINLSSKEQKILGVFTSISLGIAIIFCLIFPIFLLMIYIIYWPSLSFFLMISLIMVIFMVIPLSLFGFRIVRPIIRHEEIKKSSSTSVTILLIIFLSPMAFFFLMMFLYNWPHAITFYLSMYILFLGITAGFVLILTSIFKNKKKKKKKNKINKIVKEVNS